MRAGPGREPGEGAERWHGRGQGAVEDFIRTRLLLSPAPGVPEIRLYRATRSSGLSHFLGADAPSPYWAYGWAGGTILARYLLDSPGVARGRHVLDLGTGSGLVAIAAAKAGAASVAAVDCDPAAVTAARLNAAANGADIVFRVGDGLGGAVPAVGMMTVGDLFYEPRLARRACRFLGRCREAGIDVLVGDPGRSSLPVRHLRKLAAGEVPDFERPGGVPAAVYAFGPGTGSGIALNAKGVADRMASRRT